MGRERGKTKVFWAGCGGVSRRRDAVKTSNHRLVERTGGEGGGDLEEKSGCGGGGGGSWSNLGNGGKPGLVQMLWALRKGKSTGGD